MTKIDCKNAIKIFTQKFPDFKSYWDRHIETYGDDIGWVFNMQPLEEYTCFVIKQSDTTCMKEIFVLIERFICEGDDDLLTAIVTGYLENLLNTDAYDIRFSDFRMFLGTKSLKYCEAIEAFWDGKGIIPKI